MVYGVLKVLDWAGLERAICIPLHSRSSPADLPANPYNLYLRDIKLR